MAQKMKKADTTSSSNGTKKQRKKQAKREAKAMLKLEQTRQDVEKAERRVTKAQAQLEARRTRLHNLETEVEEMRHSQEHAEAGIDTSSATSQEPTQSGIENHENTSTPTDQVIYLPPAEGRTDVSQEQGDSSDQASPGEGADVAQGQERVQTASQNDQAEDTNTDAGE